MPYLLKSGYSATDQANELLTGEPPPPPPEEYYGPPPSQGYQTQQQAAPAQQPQSLPAAPAPAGPVMANDPQAYQAAPAPLYSDAPATTPNGTAAPATAPGGQPTSLTITLNPQGQSMFGNAPATAPPRDVGALNMNPQGQAMFNAQANGAPRPGVMDKLATAQQHAINRDQNATVREAGGPMQSLTIPATSPAQQVNNQQVGLGDTAIAQWLNNNPTQDDYARFAQRDGTFRPGYPTQPPNGRTPPIDARYVPGAADYRVTGSVLGMPPSPGLGAGGHTYPWEPSNSNFTGDRRINPAPPMEINPPRLQPQVAQRGPLDSVRDLGGTFLGALFGANAAAAAPVVPATTPPQQHPQQQSAGGSRGMGPAADLPGDEIARRQQAIRAEEAAGGSPATKPQGAHPGDFLANAIDPTGETGEAVGTFLRGESDWQKENKEKLADLLESDTRESQFVYGGRRTAHNEYPATTISQPRYGSFGQDLLGRGTALSNGTTPGNITPFDAAPIKAHVLGSDGSVSDIQDVPTNTTSPGARRSLYVATIDPKNGGLTQFLDDAPTMADIGNIAQLERNQQMVQWKFGDRAEFDRVMDVYGIRPSGAVMTDAEKDTLWSQMQGKDLLIPWAWGMEADPSSMPTFGEAAAEQPVTTTEQTGVANNASSTASGSSGRSSRSSGGGSVRSSGGGSRFTSGGRGSSGSGSVSGRAGGAAPAAQGGMGDVFAGMPDAFANPIFARHMAVRNSQWPMMPDDMFFGFPENWGGQQQEESVAPRSRRKRSRRGTTSRTSRGSRSRIRANPSSKSQTGAKTMSGQAALDNALALRG